MHSIELIRENLVVSEEIVLSKIEDMREHCTVFPTPNGGCHTLWLLGHLAFIEYQVIREFMQGAPNPLADWSETFDGDNVSGDASQFPPFDSVLDECCQSRAATIALLDTLTEADLDQPSMQCPNGAENLFGTTRRCFLYAGNHWFMHRGQFADARRAAGLQRMWY